MSTAPAGKPAREFGSAQIPAELLGIFRALSPQPRAWSSLDASSRGDLATVSKELLIEAAAEARVDCIYAFCRLNSDAVRTVATARIQAEAAPVSVDAVVAEVLAEVADSVRFVAPGRVGELYRSIPRIVESVVSSMTDEVLGFVPTHLGSASTPRLTDTLAARVDVPRSLLAGARRVIDEPTTRILAAQAILQLSATDRALLLHGGVGGRTDSTAAESVADLLSANAARRRFTDEFGRIARWLSRALEASASPSDVEGDLRT